MKRKFVFLLSLLLQLLFLTYVGFSQREVKADGFPVHNIDTGLNYATIQETVAGIHDVAVVNVSLSTYEVIETLRIDIEVVVRNEGDFTERFNVTTYANQTFNVTAIDTYFVTSLGSLDQITIPFVWNTTEVSSGNYTITAEASVLDGETDITDNIKTSDKIWVKADNTAPVIGVPVQNPDSSVVWIYTQVWVFVNVSDFGSGVRRVILLWRVENNTRYDNTMWWNQTMGYSTIPRHEYIGIIPYYDSGTWISYKIVAYDGAGNQAVRDHGSLYYVYHIIPEFPSFIILPIFMTFTLIAVIVYRRKLTV